MEGKHRRRSIELMPSGVAVTVTAGLLSLMVSVVLVLAAFVWQPWQAQQSGSGGIQGGGNPTPAPERSTTPYIP